MRRIPISLAASALALGQALASPALTSAPTTMYASASPRARVVQAIPANAEIDLDDCSKGWCHASWRNRAGYVSAKAIDTSPDAYPADAAYGPPPAPGPYYGWGWPGFYFGWGWGPGWRRW